MQTKSKQFEGNKIINAFLAVCALLLAYVIHAFLAQLNDWFDLEAQIRHYTGIIQVISVVFALISFIIIQRHKVAVTYLQEVYNELTKVVWASREDTIKLTIGILIGIIITSIILGAVDLGVSKLLGLLYK